MQGQEFMEDGDFSDWKALEWAKTEQFNGIVKAHTDLINLRTNQFGNTAGLMGRNTDLFHSNPEDNVYAYHRWNKGGIGDDTFVILNFSRNDFPEYRLNVPIAGQWTVRFNSSWSGYSSDSAESFVLIVETDAGQTVTVPLIASSALILSQD